MPSQKEELFIWDTRKQELLKNLPEKFWITASLLPQCSYIDVNVVVAFLEILQPGWKHEASLNKKEWKSKHLETKKKKTSGSNQKPGKIAALLNERRSETKPTPGDDGVCTMKVSVPWRKQNLYLLCLTAEGRRSRTFFFFSCGGGRLYQRLSCYVNNAI